MNYQEIKTKREQSTNNLFSSLGVFWAFSNEQFVKNKTPLKEGEKYVDIGAGGFMPKGNVEALTKGMKAIADQFKASVKANKAREAHILYELNNHECFYTNRTEDATNVLGSDYTEQEVKEVFKKFKAQKYVKN